MKMSYMISVGTVIALVAGGFAAVGLDVIPQIATEDDLRIHAEEENRLILKLAGSVKENRAGWLTNAIAADERRIGDLLILQGQLKASGQNSRAVKDQVNLLQRTNKDRQRELNKLSN